MATATVVQYSMETFKSWCAEQGYPVNSHSLIKYDDTVAGRSLLNWDEEKRLYWGLLRQADFLLARWSRIPIETAEKRLTVLRHPSLPKLGRVTWEEMTHEQFNKYINAYRNNIFNETIRLKYYGGKFGVTKKQVKQIASREIERAWRGK